MGKPIVDYRSQARMNARWVWLHTADTPFDEWLAQYHVRRLPVTSDLEFETNEDATAFMLKFS